MYIHNRFVEANAPIKPPCITMRSKKYSLGFLMSVLAAQRTAANPTIAAIAKIGIETPFRPIDGIPAHDIKEGVTKAKPIFSP